MDRVDDLSYGFARFVHLLLGNKCRLSVKIRIGKEPRRGTSVVEDIEIVLIVIVSHACSPADDLFKFHHRADHACDDDILACRNIDASSEQL